jgi:hypothetical protein
MPHNKPIKKVDASTVEDEDLMISMNPGMVRYAASGGTINQENNPPTIQKLSQLQPFTFL